MYSLWVIWLNVILTHINLQTSSKIKSFFFFTFKIGTKGRSEKIRTYNFAQDRITDHRIGMTVHDIKNFLMGEELLDEMNSSICEFSNQESLMELLGEDGQETL